MKFEDEIKKIASTLSEDVVPPQAGAEQVAGQNPAGVQADPAQAGQQAGQQAEVSPDQLLQFALNSDPKTLQELGIDPNAQGDDLFQAVQTAFTQSQSTQDPAQAGQDPAQAGQPSTASAQPAAQSTSGVPGATQVGV